MAEPTIAISIVCADHIPERKAALHRLLVALSEVPHHIETGKKTCREWSEGQWDGAVSASVSHGSSHGLFLNDDLILCPNFIHHVRAAMAAKPDEVVSFHPNHPGARVAYERRLAWITSNDGLVGTAYCVPMDLLAEFLQWRKEKMLPEALDAYSEDGQINLWCMDTGRRIWHTVPGLFVHDPRVASLYNHDDNPLKQSTVGFHEVELDSVKWDTDALHVGNVYVGNFWALITHLRPECRNVKRAYELAKVGASVAHAA